MINIKQTVFTFLVILGLTGTGLCFAASSNLAIEIKLTKAIFSNGEPVKGKILIQSSIPTTYPASFHIKIFRNDVLVRHATTRTPVFFGSNAFELDSFGITQIKATPNNIGEWRIVITYSTLPLTECETQFSIVDKVATY